MSGSYQRRIILGMGILFQCLPAAANDLPTIVKFFFGSKPISNFTLEGKKASSREPCYFELKSDPDGISVYLSNKPSSSADKDLYLLSLNFQSSTEFKKLSTDGKQMSAELLFSEQDEWGDTREIESGTIELQAVSTGTPKLKSVTILNRDPSTSSRRFSLSCNF